jgi:hypothetical protein
MDWTLRSGKEQEMPSQPQGSPSAGLQLPSLPAVALKAVFSSSSASPATQSHPSVLGISERDKRLDAKCGRYRPSGVSAMDAVEQRRSAVAATRAAACPLPWLAAMVWFLLGILGGV